MFGHSMFGVFEVRYFGVRSKTNTNTEGTDFGGAYALPASPLMPSLGKSRHIHI